MLSKDTNISYYRVTKFRKPLLFFLTFVLLVEGFFVGFQFYDINWRQVYFYTHWNFYFMIFFTLSFFLTNILLPKPDSPLVKTTRVLHNLAYSGELMLVPFYWAVLSKADIGSFHNKPYNYYFSHVNNAMLHGSGLIMVILPFFLDCRLKIEKIDALYVMGFGIVYFVFNMIISLTIRPIYHGFTYRNVFSFIGAVVAILLLLAWWGLGYGVNRLQEKKRAQTKDDILREGLTYDDEEA